MTFGADIILICPHCRNIFIRNTLGSGNSFGARVWSDGKMIAPMMPILPIIAWCGECRNYFFIEDAIRVGYAPQGAFLSQPFVINVWDDMEEKDYEKALRDGIPTYGNKGRERELRIRLWWILNDPRRHVDDQKGSYEQPAFVENLQQLDSLLAKATSAELRIMRAEVMRELGHCDDAVDLLNKICGDIGEEEMDWLRRKAEKIKEHAVQGDIKVFELTAGTDGENNR